MKYLAVNNPLTLTISIDAPTGVEGAEVISSRIPTIDSKVKIDGFNVLHELQVSIAFTSPATITQLFTLKGTSIKTGKFLTSITMEPYLLEGDSATIVVPFVVGSVSTPLPVTVSISDAGQDKVKID